MSTTTELLKANERYERLRAAIEALAVNHESSLGVVCSAENRDWAQGWDDATDGFIYDLRALLKADA